MTLPWRELVPALSINPDMATREDVARLAAFQAAHARLFQSLRLEPMSGAGDGERCGEPESAADFHQRQLRAAGIAPP